MVVKEKLFHVEGMTCASCEARIGQALRRLDGVVSAKVSQAGGTAIVRYEESKVGDAALKATIEKAGYVVKDRAGGAATMIALGIGVFLAAGYLIASQAGLFNALPRIDASLGYGMLFVVGLLTSVHCVAMCGGIALSQSVGTGSVGTGTKVPAIERAAAGLFAERVARLRPGLLYNGGRVLSYTLVGALVGALGSAFSFSPVIKGIIAAAAGLFMVLLGLKMLGLLARLPKMGGFLPAGLRQSFDRLTSSFKKRGPFAVGFLNGFIPCGPLQTMQLYALGTGSAAAGALSMLIFSIGTVPLMLVFGLAAALLPRKFLPIMVRASAVLVMFLGAMTFARAAALAGIDLPSLSPPSLVSRADSDAERQRLRQALVIPVAGAPGAGASTASGLITSVVEDGFQTVLTEFGPNGYVPFVVQAGLPLRWTIRVSADNLNGCNNPIQVPAYGIEKTLVPGDNLIEFTPTKEGTIAYSCWMGMIRSRITVVKDVAGLATLPPSQRDALALPPDQGGGGGCCSGSSNAAFAGGKVPVDIIGIPMIDNGVQVIEVTVDGQGYSPAAFVVQKGKKTIVRFKATSLNSCNNPVFFPDYNGGLDLEKGQFETPPLDITQDITFQCGMGMLHGYVKVVDNLDKVDLAKVRAEIGAWKAPGGGGCCGG